MRKIQFILFLFISINSFSQQRTAKVWVDSVFKSLSPDEQIAQLMVVRLSTINANKSVTFYDSLVSELIRQYNIGSICVFQGSPTKQANILNELQAKAKFSQAHKAATKLYAAELEKLEAESPQLAAQVRPYLEHLLAWDGCIADFEGLGHELVVDAMEIFEESEASVDVQVDLE